MFEPFAGRSTSFTMVRVADGSRSTCVIVAASIFNSRRTASRSPPAVNGLATGAVWPDAEKQLSSAATQRDSIFLFIGVCKFGRVYPAVLRVVDQTMKIPTSLLRGCAGIQRSL